MEKAGLISLVKMRYLTTDDDLSLRGHALQEAIARDKEDGLIPFYVNNDAFTSHLHNLHTITAFEIMWYYKLKLDMFIAIEKRKKSS